MLKAMTDALQASEIRYRRLFEAAKDGILMLDAESGETKTCRFTPGTGG